MKDKNASSHDHITILNQSQCDDDTVNEIRNKIFKLQSRFIEDLKEIQECKPEIKMDGKISFNLTEATELGGGVKISMVLND